MNKEETNNLSNTDFEILWEGKPWGLWQRFLDIFGLNFTKYQITKDELIIQKGFFNRKTNTLELYTLKDPDLIESLYQRMIHVGTITLHIDAHGAGSKFGAEVRLKNIENPAEVRKLLRDAIEQDVLERKITYFDKV